MQQLESKSANDYLAVANSLAREFAQTAVVRDQQGGTPKAERDRIRQTDLLKLTIPKANGGIGENWFTVFAIIRELAKVDSSIAHILSYHYLGISIPHIFGSSAQKAHYYNETAHHNWFWCNALNPLDRRTILTHQGDLFRLSGHKSFCSGSQDSDMLPVTATHQETGEMLIMAIPTQREGIYIQSDWDNIGQRQTDSGSIIFDNVLVYPEEIFGSRDHLSQPFATIRSCLTQLNLANIYSNPK
jgi:alkylation response protein AidB-like acyl-CoA dehydrogenase